MWRQWLVAEGIGHAALGDVGRYCGRCISFGLDADGVSGRPVAARDRYPGTWLQIYGCHECSTDPGQMASALVLLVDLAKGAAAVVMARWLYAWLLGDPTISAPDLLGTDPAKAWGVLVAGIAVLLGHGRSVWLNFTGGKSAATGLGVLLAMTPVTGLVAALVWAIVLATTRIVSLSSILAACAGIVLAIGLGQPFQYLLLVVAGGVYVIARHAANIQRLLNGTEPRLGHKAS